MKKIVNWIEKNKTTLEILVSLFSAVLVLLTLYEMKAERNAAYRPTLYLSNTEFAVVWDENGLPSDETELCETISKAMVYSNKINITPQISLHNIGVGSAQNIIIDWEHENNLQKYIDAFDRFNDIEIFTDKINQVHIVTDGVEQSIGGNYDTSYDFILNSSDEYIMFPYPLIYHKLNIELIKRNEDIPDIALVLSYNDIQGKKYSENVTVSVDTYFGVQQENGSGGYVLNLIAKKEKNMLNQLNVLGFTTDDFVAITSFFTVIISVISVCFTYKSNKNQMEHNKNSVKPISSIKVNDYEDKLAVKIYNYGTGPLIIKKMVAKNDEMQSDKLLDFMPEINQHWSTFVGTIDGSKIPVNGCITLIELNPENEETKMAIRKYLKDITIYLEYTDIYSTSFTDQRKLDFFGRHF